MTRINDLGDKDGSDLSIRFANLPAILSQFDTELIQAAENLELKGKRLDIANRENSTWQNYYDQRKAELGSLLKYMEAQVARTRGRLFKNMSDQNQKDFSDRAKDKFIDAEKSYLDIYELYLEVDEMYNKYKSIVDGFTARGYSLNNITKLRVAAIEDSII